MLASVLKVNQTDFGPNFHSCPAEHYNMLHSSPIFNYMCCIVSGFTVDLEAEWKTVDPDQMASEKLADLDLHCFQNRTYPSSAG